MTSKGVEQGVNDPAGVQTPAPGFKPALASFLRRRPPIQTYPWIGVLVWLLAWAVLLVFRQSDDLLNLTMVLVLASALSALWLPPAVSLSASLVSSMVFNFMFVQPRGQFAHSLDEHHEFVLITVGALSWIIAWLMAGQRELAAQERIYALRAEQLQSLGDRLRDADDPRDVAPHLQTALALLLGHPVALWVQPGPEDPMGDGLWLGSVVDEQRNKLLNCARDGAGQTADPDAWCLPLRGRRAGFGAVHLSLPQREAVLSLHSHAQAMCDQMGLALERQVATHAAAVAQQEAHAQQLRSTLLTAISHDYRTPLSTILGAASSLKDQADRLKPGQRQHLLDVIVDEVQQLACVTNNTLQIARLDSPGVSLHLDWESAEEMIGTVLRRARQRDPTQVIHARVEEGLPLLRCDAVLMVQLLDNLVDNAFKHGGADEPVEIVATREADRLLLAVRDRGPGVPTAWRERVFDIFARVGQAGDATPKSDQMVRRGAGLGLAVCRIIARVHGGELTLRARLGGGSSLECRLPLEPPPPLSGEASE